MSAIYGWVRNITCYLIFMTVLTNLLPNKKYEKFIRLFAGMVLILIVMKPLTAGLRLDDQIAGFFEAITFQNEASDFKNELSGMEQKRLESMVGQYEEAVKTDVGQMAEAAGFYAKQVQVTIDSDPQSERFMTVTAISMSITGKFPDLRELGGDREGMGEMVPVEPVTPVEPVKIGEGVQEDSAKEPGEEARARHETENTEVRALRQKLAGYYNLEAEYVEIRLEDG